MRASNGRRIAVSPGPSLSMTSVFPAMISSGIFAGSKEKFTTVTS